MIKFKQHPILYSTVTLGLSLGAVSALFSQAQVSPNQATVAATQSKDARASSVITYLPVDENGKTITVDQQGHAVTPQTVTADDKGSYTGPKTMPYIPGYVADVIEGANSGQTTQKALTVTYRYRKDEDSHLRIASFNIAANKNPDLAVLRTDLIRQNIDIAGLQEIDKNASRTKVDMLDYLGRERFSSQYFTAAIPLMGGEYGIGTVARYPLTDTSGTLYTRDSSLAQDEDRAFQRSVIDKNGKKVSFYNTHLSFESPALRKNQFAQLIAALKKDPNPYLIVTGDFNTDQSEDEFNQLNQYLDMANGYRGKWFETFHEEDPTMKVNTIDNIFVSRNITINDVAMDAQNKHSDHYMLVADVTLGTLSDKKTSVAVSTGDTLVKTLHIDSPQTPGATLLIQGAGSDVARYRLDGKGQLDVYLPRQLAQQNLTVTTQVETLQGTVSTNQTRINLTALTAEKSQLERLVRLAKKEKSGQYAKTEWQQLQKAITASEQLLKSKATTQNAIHQQFLDLKKHIK